ncbi:MAG TPA: creatininase family protein [Nitrosopumilaceae archaeon]
MVIVRDQRDPDLRKIIKKQKAVIIPVGSIEQHGPHLPVSTDSDIVSEIAKRVSDKCNFLLVPTISYGVSFEHAPFFNLSLREHTLELLLIDICLSLSSNNIDTIFILNGHHGNQKSLTNLSQEIKRLSKKKIRVFVFSYWHFIKHEFDHAGFVETSLMLAISKRVKMKLAQKGLITKNMPKKQKLSLAKRASISFSSVALNGIWGDPTKSTVKDGERFLAEIVRNLAKKSQTCLTEKSPKLHQ